MTARLPCVIHFTTVWLLMTSAVPAGETSVTFNRDIKPILSDTCYKCHGPDANERQTEFRLDQKQSALGEADSGGLVIVPGSSAESLLYQRISSDDSYVKMPPPESGKALTDEQIARFKNWIDQGAPWEEHWSFVAPVRHPLPQVEHSSLLRSPIDNFIFARVETAGLSPSPLADKQTLIRRVTFDLTGLPPTLEEIDAFLADDSPDAYEKVVDRLLKSPRYGEHMTRYWLDAARYGDTHGLHLDNKRQLWPYRDWVIRAFNSNMPFDQFTIEQLAGDLLPNATEQQVVATGFNRCNVTTSEGGSIAEEYRVRYAVDRVETTATVWMGLTLGCAVCHDHKFDPVSQQEFYRLFAYFNSLTENPMDGNALLPPPIAKAPTPMQRERLASIEKDIEDLNSALSKRRAESAGKELEWIAQLQEGGEKLPSDMMVHCPLDETTGNKVTNAADAGQGMVKGKAQWVSGKFAGALQFEGNTHVDLGDTAALERSATFSYGAWVNPANNNHMAVLSRMDDGAKHRGYDLYLGGGKVYVHIINTWDNNAIRVNTKSTLAVNKWQHVMMTYDGSSKAEGVRIYIDGQPAEVEITHNSLSGTIKTSKPLRIGRRNPGAPMHGTIDDVRIYARELTAAEVGLLAGLNPIQEIVAIPPERWTDRQRELLREHYLKETDPEYSRRGQAVADLNKQKADVQAAIPASMVMQDMATMRPAYLLVRGQYDQPDKSQELLPGIPSTLPPLPEDAPPNRLGLAKWLVDRSHPLTARVTVNRLWQQLFGTGIVKTAEDFGSQGEWPSHPQLLDWLAVEFLENGWDVKHMMKLMVTSHTYQQSSHVTPVKLAKDKDNRLLSRGPRFRMDAEMIRDNALAVSGLLVEQVGGPSVKPYQPDGLWRAVGYSGSNTVKFTQDHGDSLFRRSMYIFWKRTAPPPTMQIFDAPSREYCVVRRERTNTPAAALVLMNDVQFVEAARRFAERMTTEGGKSPEERITFAHRLATARPPNSDELQVLVELYNATLQEFTADEAAAAKLVSVGESPRDQTLDVSELAAWTVVASTILNLDETITKG